MISVLKRYSVHPCMVVLMKFAFVLLLRWFTFVSFVAVV